MRNTLVQSLAECVKKRLNGRDSATKLLEMLPVLGENRNVSGEVKRLNLLFHLMYSLGYKLSVCRATGLLLILSLTIRNFAFSNTLAKKVCLSVHFLTLLDLDAFEDFEIEFPSGIWSHKIVTQNSYSKG